MRGLLTEPRRAECACAGLRQEPPARQLPGPQAFHRFPALAQLPAARQAWTFELCPGGTDTLICYLPLPQGMCTIYVATDGAASLHARAGHMSATPIHGTVHDIVRRVSDALRVPARAPSIGH